MCSVLDVRLLFLRNWPGKSESTKLEMRSLEPPLPKTIGLPSGIVSEIALCIWSACKTLVFLVILVKTEPLVRHLSNMLVCEESVYS